MTNQPAFDTADDEDGPVVLARVRPHLSIFVPSLVVLLLYGGLWLVLAAQCSASGGLGRLALIVCSLGVPVLLVHAFLRYSTTGAELTAGGLTLYRGWPRRGPVVITLSEIAGLSMRRPLLANVSGGHVLVVTRTTGKRYRIADIEDPSTFIAQVEGLTGGGDGGTPVRQGGNW